MMVDSTLKSSKSTQMNNNRTEARMLGKKLINNSSPNFIKRLSQLMRYQIRLSVKLMAYTSVRPPVKTSLPLATTDWTPLGLTWKLESVPTSSLPVLIKHHRLTQYASAQLRNLPCAQSPTFVWSKRRRSPNSSDYRTMEDQSTTRKSRYQLILART